MRLDKLLATLGIGSRSQVQKLIRQGKVTVDGKTCVSPDFSFAEGMAVTCCGSVLDCRLSRHIMMNKPAGLLTAARDKKQQTVMDLLPPEMVSLGCMPVGRLDRDTTGLLLFTTDGEMNHRLLSPGRHVDKTYYAKVEGVLDASHIAAFSAGIDLGDFKTAPAVLEIVSACENFSAARLTIHEGKFHQVKRMFESVGHPVTMLHRESFGGLTLPEDLPEGAWRELTRNELAILRKSAFEIKE